jgi:hypothetical protein
MSVLVLCSASHASASADNGSQFIRQETHTITPDGDTGLAWLTIELPPGEFALVTLENRAYPAAMTLVSDHTTLKQGYSEIGIFLTQLLIEPGMCSSCTIRIEVPYGKKSRLNLALSVNYASQANKSRFQLEKKLEEIMLHSWNETPTLRKTQLLALKNQPNNTGLPRYCYHINTVTDQRKLDLTEIYYTCYEQLKENHLAEALHFKTRHYNRKTEKSDRTSAIHELEDYVQELNTTKFDDIPTKQYLVAEALRLASIRHANLGHHRKAEKLINESIELFSRTENHTKIALALMTKAENFRFQNNLQDASKTLKLALHALHKSFNKEMSLYEQLLYLSAGYSMQAGELYTA